MTKPRHDAAPLLREPFERPMLYQAICRCGWRGEVQELNLARARAEWHNDHAE